ncbi:hypothetical protein RZO31_13635 [Lactococcus lactis]|uniref:Uncharacterized protein n=1 Tax=Lactococcus lactis TaxID=1358 RepID=A0AAE4T089_9LACT|nr:hypothetical protein [Lactococcus lactis]MDV2633889.1 hypothetical protein [Lactococcus lactis]
MNKPIYETIKTYGSDSELYVTKRIVGHERVTRNGLSRKKKPISMIKALKVRGRMERKKIFYNSEIWEEIRKKHLHKNTALLSEVGGGTVGKVTVTNLETGESKTITGYREIERSK